MEKASIKLHGRVGDGQVTTDYKPITNNQMDPGSNPSRAILLKVDVKLFFSFFYVLYIWQTYKLVITS